MSVLMSMLLGLIQGIAEFLPISSSGHLSILQNLLGLEYSEQGHLLFDVFLHVGTLISIFVVYKKDIRNMLRDSLDYLRGRPEPMPDDQPQLKPSVRTVLFIIIGSVPLLVSLILAGYVKRLFYNTGFIGFALIISGALLYVADKYIKKGSKTEKTMTLADAVVIGLAQAVAVIPGLSRSGTTIVVGLSRGFDRDFAVRFSLFLSIPAVIASLLYSLLTAIQSGAELALIPMYLPGLIVAAVVGIISITILRGLAARGRFGVLAYYCWFVGALSIVLSIVL